MTCKALASVFAAKVLRSVKIDILDVDDNGDYLDQLNLLACGQSKVPTHLIRILDIWSLSPANNSKYINAGGSSRFKPVDKTAIEERITRALKPALQTLEQVHTLRCVPEVTGASLPSHTSEYAADLRLLTDGFPECMTRWPPTKL